MSDVAGHGFLVAVEGPDRGVHQEWRARFVVPAADRHRRREKVRPAGDSLERAEAAHRGAGDVDSTAVNRARGQQTVHDLEGHPHVLVHLVRARTLRLAPIHVGPRLLFGHLRRDDDARVLRLVQQEDADAPIGLVGGPVVADMLQVVAARLPGMVQIHDQGIRPAGGSFLWHEQPAGHGRAARAAVGPRFHQVRGGHALDLGFDLDRVIG
jgi:hypothetical protein